MHVSARQPKRTDPGTDWTVRAFNDSLVSLVQFRRGAACLGILVLAHVRRDYPGVHASPDRIHLVVMEDIIAPGSFYTRLLSNDPGPEHVFQS